MAILSVIISFSIDDGLAPSAFLIPNSRVRSRTVISMNRINIEQLGIQDLSDAVKHFSGVTVQDYGGIGGLKTVSVRSLGAKHTAVSYDGVAVTDAQSGQVDISRFSLDNVNAISLSIGQADEIFQTARMYSSAGALSIQTASPEFKDKTFNVFAKMKAGSFGLYNPSVRYEQQLGKQWSASVYSDWTKANGEYKFTLVNDINPPKNGCTEVIPSIKYLYLITTGNSMNR